jgi:nucleotide-binding universal stress UspA family protein
MFKNIAVATDGSNNGSRAVEFGARLASTCGSRLTILHVVPAYMSLEEAEAAPGLPPDVRADIKRIRDTLGDFETSAFAPIPAPQSAIDYIGNSLLARADQAARDAGAANTSSALAYGDPAEKIVEEAEKRGADLIVVGTRGLSELGGLVMGSVSHRVIHLAHCPCVTVK